MRHLVELQLRDLHLPASATQTTMAAMARTGPDLVSALSSTITLCRLAEDFGLQLGAAADAPDWRHIVNRSGAALCGHCRVEAAGPLSLWGVETEAQERWCLLCAAEATELLEKR
jgi:hypothetical protein